MDINAPKTPATLPFAAWQALAPAEAARAVHQRIASLPENLRHAALAWLRPEQDLSENLQRMRTNENALALAGVPYLAKDLFDLPGVPTRAGSTFLDRVRATPATASALIARLNELGGVCAGKTHLVEFAAGLFGDNSHYGDCPHPVFADRLSGGSSSGSAALVAAGVVPLALGTDTGGSVRVPAAFCGVYGFRLTPGDPFIRDAFPLSPTLDTAGWFTGGAADMLAAWRALVPGASAASAVQHEPRGGFFAAQDFDFAFDAEVAAAYDRAAAGLAASIDPAVAADLKASWAGSNDAYSVIALSEAHAIHRDWLGPFQREYEPSIWQRFSAGGNYPPAQIDSASAVLRTGRESWHRFFQAYDFLVLPCAPFPALHKIDCTPEARAQLLTLTTPASLGGLPVLTVPIPLPSGLTAGLQLVLPAAESAVVPWILGQR